MRRLLVTSISVVLLAALAIPEIIDVYWGFSAKISGRRINFRRRLNGVVDIFGRDELDFARGLGYLHAKDRGVQLYLMKIIGEGRLTECVKYDENFLKIDMGIRNLQFARVAKATVPKLSKEGKAYAEAYVDGINKYFETHRKPLEFWLVNYTPEQWKVSDVLTVMQLTSYVGLVELQSDAEKFILQIIQKSDAGASLMKRMFSPHLDALDTETISLLRQVRVERPYFPPEIRSLLPAMSASNAWAVSANKSASGRALLAGDPHLPVDRLPPVWYEVVMHLPNDYIMGITTPGVPGLLMGRNSNISYSFTYGCMDLVDFWMEECEGEKCRLDDQPTPYTDLSVIHEQLRLKKKPNPEGGPYEVLDLYIYQTAKGAVIERVNATVKGLERGIWLSRKISAQQVLANAEVLFKLSSFQNVEDAIRTLSIPIPLSSNFHIADAKGNIAYRQVGALPARRNTGLTPLPGWKPDSHWVDLYSAKMTTQILNPREGYVATTNNEIGSPQLPLSVSIHIGEYRLQRLKHLFSQRSNFTLQDMKDFQNDLYSVQAEQYMQLLRPILSKPPEELNTAIINELGTWDSRYNKESKGAVLFEQFHRALMRDIFEPILGSHYWSRVDSDDTRNTLAFFFDRLFLHHMQRDDELLWHGETQAARLKRVLLKTFENRTEVSSAELTEFGSTRQIRMWNMFFSGNLPSFLGFEPTIVLEGTSATLRMGRLAPSSPKGRSAKGVSYRFVTDMSEHQLHSALAGGVTGSRLSYWYTSDLQLWLNNQYKQLRVFE